MISLKIRASRCFNLRIESLVIERPKLTKAKLAIGEGFNLRIESLVIERKNGFQ